MDNNLFTVTIESIDVEGKGIARIDGKTVFINDVLPNEVVTIEIVKRKPTFDKGRLVEILQKSPERVTPECPNFGLCGGCSLQHIEFEAQVRNKQKVLLDNLKHIGKVNTEAVLPPLLGKPFRYRHRARMSIRHVAKKGGVLVGFHEKGSSFVADMQECLNLPKHISDLIPILRNTMGQLSIYNKVPQVEVAVGDNVSVLLFRVMEPLSDNDEVIIKNFADTYSTAEYPLQIWLQPKGPDSCYPFYPLDAPKLSYSLPKFNLDMPYYPTEFTQVNPTLNQEMVALAMDLLDPKPDEAIADFFCGIGNFTLPIAISAKSVLGVEGSQQLVARALENAVHNKLENKTTYKMANLFKIDQQWLQDLGKMDKWLIDPPRDGAAELIQSITPEIAPNRIVYVSCNPATLARDAATLVNIHNYRLTQAGVMNMFPQTSHVESIAVFEKGQI